MVQDRTAEFSDDDLLTFEADGAPALPETASRGFVAADGAQLWHAVYSRGHGRSTRNERPYSYELLAGDVRAVMDALGLDQATLLGWSDGACTALVVADKHPGRVKRVIYFAQNMDLSGVKDLSQLPPIVGRCLNRHVQDYQQLSSTPDQFANFAQAVEAMQQTQPNYTAHDLTRIQAPVTVVLGEHDEFIKREHAEYIAETIPGATFVLLPGVSHFAPLQRPARFNAALLTALAEHGNELTR